MKEKSDIGKNEIKEKFNKKAQSITIDSNALVKALLSKKPEVIKNEL